MTETYQELMRRRAARLVLEKQFAPEQAAKILTCSIQAVRKWVAEFLDLQPPPTLTPDAAPFLSVEIVEDEHVTSETTPEPPPEPMPETTIPIDILTPNGLTLRFQLSSLHDLVALLQSLEVSC